MHINREIAISKNLHNTDFDRFSFGIDYLMECLHALQTAKGDLLTVGVVGYPKVGRHTIIRNICDTSATFGADSRSNDALNDVSWMGDAWLDVASPY